MKIFILQLLLCSALMSVVSLIYCFASKLLRGIQLARYRYFVWFFIGIGFLTPFKPRLADPVVELNVQQPVLSPETGVHILDMEEKVFLPDVWQIVFILWICGLSLFLIYNLVVQMRFRKSAARLSREADEETKSLLYHVCSDMNIHRSVSVRFLPVISSPMLTGIFHPCILLPESVFSSEELRLVLKHELMHLKRGDLYMELFWLICCAVHWFNPVLLLFYRHVRQECELACDEEVMCGEASEAAAVYCRAILKSAESAQKAETISPAVSTSFTSGKRNLKMRMTAIFSNRRKYPFWIICLLVCLITLGTGTVFACAQTNGENDLFDGHEEFFETSVESKLPEEYADLYAMESEPAEFSETTAESQKEVVEVSSTTSTEHSEETVVTSTVRTEIDSDIVSSTSPVIIRTEPPEF